MIQRSIECALFNTWIKINMGPKIIKGLIEIKRFDVPFSKEIFTIR